MNAKNLSLMLLIVAACQQKTGPDTPVASPAQPATVPAVAPTTSTAAAAGGKFKRGDTQIVSGKDCGSYGTSVGLDKPFERDGNVFARKERYGCGCPTGPLFTLVYEPKTSPLVARVCFDQTKDRCEMACEDNIGFDLTAPLAEAGAKEVTFVK